MPRFTPETRAAAQAEVLARLRDGETAAAIHRTAPHLPPPQTLYDWARADPPFAAALAEARTAGAHRRRAHDRLFDAARARRFLARYAAGEPLTRLLADPDMPGGRRRLELWRLLEPEFAAELHRLKAEHRAHHLQRLAARRHIPFDPAIADRVAILSNRGLPLKAIHAHDPTLPGHRTILRWAEQNRDFAVAIGFYGRVWRGRRRGATQTKLTPAVRDHILSTIATGGALTDLAHQPDMPNPATVHRWRRRHPGFAADLAHARRIALQVRIDHLHAALDTPGPSTRKAREYLAAKVRRLVRRLEREG
jgi:transposase-like protein